MGCFLTSPTRNTQFEWPVVHNRFIVSISDSETTSHSRVYVAYVHSCVHRYYLFLSDMCNHTTGKHVKITLQYKIYLLNVLWNWVSLSLYDDNFTCRNNVSLEMLFLHVFMCGRNVLHRTIQYDFNRCLTKSKQNKVTRLKLQC